MLKTYLTKTFSALAVLTNLQAEPIIHIDNPDAIGVKQNRPVDCGLLDVKGGRIYMTYEFGEALDGQHITRRNGAMVDVLAHNKFAHGKCVTQYANLLARAQGKNPANYSQKSECAVEDAYKECKKALGL